MKTNRWHVRSIQVILREIDAGRDAGETTAQIRKRVDAAYPFGVRAHWPYKQWLAVRRELFFRHQLRTEREREAENRAMMESPLFGGGDA